MFCEAYDQSLEDAAASGEALSPMLKQHLASCGSCRDAFAEEQSLFAAIDSGLHIAANSEVPTTLIPRVHVALNSAPISESRSLRWLFAGAVFAAVLVLAFGLTFNQRGLPSSGKNATVQIAAPPLALPESTPLEPFPVLAVPRRQSRTETIQPISAKAESAFFGGEVLVPDEERAAFARFLSSHQPTAGTVSVAISLVPQAPKMLVPLQAVEIASLRVPSLNGEEASRDELKEVPSTSQPSKEMK